MRILPLLTALAVLSATPARAGRPAKGRGAEVFILGNSVYFYFSMREADPRPHNEKTVVWQRWQLACDKSGTCSALNFHKLSDPGAGQPCSVDTDRHIGIKFETVRFDLAAGDVVVRVTDTFLGTGDLRIRFEPKTSAIRTAEVDFVLKADSPEEIADSPFAQETDEVRKFRMPARSSVVRPACVFLEEGAAPLG